MKGRSPDLSSQPELENKDYYTDYYTNIGWWRVHYTVYGTKKSDNGRGEAEAIIAFLSPVNCIVDELPSNICYIIHIGKILTMLL